MKNTMRTIMTNAWKFVKKFGYTISEALKMAWRNAKAIALAKQIAEIKEECHTWYSWKVMGMEVIHESTALFKVVVEDPGTKNGTRVLSYFGNSQVAPIALAE